MTCQYTTRVRSARLSQRSAFFPAATSISLTSTFPPKRKRRDLSQSKIVKTKRFQVPFIPPNMSFTLAECPTSALNCGTPGSSVAIQITGFALKVLKVLQALLGHSHRLLRLLPQVQ